MAAIKPKGVSFTVKELNAITVNDKGRSLSDGASLYGRVEVTKGLPKIRWGFDFKWQGSVVRYYCGTYPEKSMKEIREIRERARALVKKKIDPRVQRDVDRIEKAEEQQAVIKREEMRQAEALTLQDLFDVWVDMGVKRKDDNKDIKARFNNHLLPVIGKKQIQSLTELDLIRTYSLLINQEKYRTTEELHKDVRQMLRWAEKRQPWRKLLIEGNPAGLVELDILIPSDYTKVRTRVLKDSEITKLYEVFKDDPIQPWIQLAAWICLSCTSRIGELMLAEWQHIDFEAKTWFIPKENSKGREKIKTDHTVFLSDFALDKFMQLKELAAGSPWVFPAKNKDSHVIESAASKAIGDRQIKFMNRTKPLSNRTENNELVIGEKKWTIHDLRRTSATMIQRVFPGAKDGGFIALLCLHHKVFTGAAVHYLHHHYEPQMREAWQLVGEQLELLTTHQGSNVVAFNQ